MFGGPNPLSKIGGRPIKEIFNQKDLNNERKTEIQSKYQEIYRPPGLISGSQRLYERSDLPHKDKFWFCNPSSYMYVREQRELPSFKGKDVQVLNDQTTNKLRELNERRSIKENLVEKRVRDVIFKDQYEEQLPPDADDLIALNSSLKDKEGSKDEEISKYKKNADDKFRRIKNLVPDSNKINISSLRMEEFEDQRGQDRRNKSMMRMMNAPAVSTHKEKEDLIIEQLKNQHKGTKNL